MDIRYAIQEIPDLAQIIEVYNSSGIRRPTHDVGRIRRMYEQANLVISAWDGARLVGIARSLTDFCYCCYLSDLAVRKAYQRMGIGKKLIELTLQEIGEESMLLLLAAQEAMNYYPRLGFMAVQNGFIIPRKK
ncbi:MAG: GNAT family N-acetyltransferase [Thermoflavifilum sp.]|nr:GNAT family N-acetyltransferase [Thermoflavifilum sp.]